MPSTTFIALGIASTLVLGLVIAVGGFSLLVGALESLFGKPKLIVLKPEKYDAGFAFVLKWNAAKEPVTINNVEVRLFNPHGKPTQVQVARSIEGKKDSFAEEVDLGKSYINLLSAENLEQGRVQVELAATKEGVSFQFEYPAIKFKNMIEEADATVSNFSEESEDTSSSNPPIGIPARTFIADTVPGKGAQLAIATNPTFEAYFQNMGGGSGGAGGAAEEAKENFNVEKVWIEPGCIVCNACEDIYPEVFEVLPDTCIIRPNAPLDDGLRVEEAAEACPVEVIKFTKASV